MADTVGAIFGIMSILFLLIWLVFFVVIIGGIVFWIFMIVDVAKRGLPKPDDKTLWILIVVLAGLIGSIIYYFMIKRKDKK